MFSKTDVAMLSAPGGRRPKFNRTRTHAHARTPPAANKGERPSLDAVRSTGDPLPAKNQDPFNQSCKSVPKSCSNPGARLLYQHSLTGRLAVRSRTSSMCVYAKATYATSASTKHPSTTPQPERTQQHHSKHPGKQAHCPGAGQKHAASL